MYLLVLLFNLIIIKGMKFGLKMCKLNDAKSRLLYQFSFQRASFWNPFSYIRILSVSSIYWHYFKFNFVKVLLLTKWKKNQKKNRKNNWLIELLTFLHVSYLVSFHLLNEDVPRVLAKWRKIEWIRVENWKNFLVLIWFGKFWNIIAIIF